MYNKRLKMSCEIANKIRGEKYGKRYSCVMHQVQQGLLHIGNARTALFNYLYARHHVEPLSVSKIRDRKRSCRRRRAFPAWKPAPGWKSWDARKLPPIRTFGNSIKHTSTTLGGRKSYKFHVTEVRRKQLNVNAKKRQVKRCYINEFTVSEKESCLRVAEREAAGVIPTVREWVWYR